MSWWSKWIGFRLSDLLFLVIVIFLILAYRHDVAELQARALHPCDYCTRCNPFLALNITLPTGLGVNASDGEGRLVPASGGDSS